MEIKDSRQMFKTGFSQGSGVIFLSDDELSKMKAAVLEIFKDFIRVAEKYSLHYVLGGGSALGAVRHKGFIPWDDDIDINMPRRDYNELRKVFEGEMGDRYMLCTPEDTPGHGMLSAQIKKKNTVYRSFNELSKKREDCGIGIDIFVIENAFGTSIARAAHGALCLAAGYLVTCRKTACDYPWIKSYLTPGTEAARAFKKKAAIGRIFSFIPLDRAVRAGAGCYSLCKDDDSEYVTAPSGRGHYFHEMRKRADFCEEADAEFEGVDVKITANYDAYLRPLYGDSYMEIPPEGKRERHPIMELDFGEDA